MLNHGRVLIFLAVFVLNACSSTSTHPQVDPKKIAMQTVGDANYALIYVSTSDSVKTWALNQLGLNNFKEGQYEYQIDSLLSFDKTGNRLVTCILVRTLSANSLDGLIYLYGEKINNMWYFLRGESIIIPRSIVKNHDASKPLSYTQLHEIALKEVYAPYLDASGNINEGWFKQCFENVGWCADCKTSEDFRKSFYESAMAQWANRDTMQPIKRLEKNNKTLP